MSEPTKDLSGLHHDLSRLPKDFIFPGKPSTCKWALGTKEPSPHTYHQNAQPRELLPTILSYVGSTPLVRLNKIPKMEGLECEMYGKCEFLNPGGSVKDRIGFRMVEDAEKKGLLKPGCTIIEPTSGNTGIGLAMAAAVKGYKCLIVLPDKMSNEKVSTLRALGADVVRTPVEEGIESPEGLINVAQQIQKTIPDSIILDQYMNPGNPLSHYDGTADEILFQCKGKVDMIICPAGTGGTVSGIGRKFKEKNPNCVVVGVDPEGSILARPEAINDSEENFYEVEGIGYDFIPTVLDHQVVDFWTKVRDPDCFAMAKKLIRHEGLLCGGSSGAVTVAGCRAAKNLKKGQVCVVILPDNIRNYLSKFVSDNWMISRHFMEPKNEFNHWWFDHKVSELNLKPPLTIKGTISCKEAFAIMKSNNIEQIPIVDDDGTLLGSATVYDLINKIVSLNLKDSEPIRKLLIKRPIKVHMDTNLGKVARILEQETYVFVVQVLQQQPGKNLPTDKEIICGVINRMDILSFITSGPVNGGKNGS